MLKEKLLNHQETPLKIKSLSRIKRFNKIAKRKEVIVTETGWPSKGQVVGEASPSSDNLMIYFNEAQDWAKAANVQLLHFSSFDETWKIRFEGGVGTSWRLGM